MTPSHSAGLRTRPEVRPPAGSNKRRWTVLGYHYVPQEYLRGFATPDNPDMIWMYDKHTGKSVRASIKQVAQQPGYYSAEVERELNDRVEGPANIVLRKLRRGEMIDSHDREKLELYIGTMLMRVPRRRRKALEMLPEVLEDTALRVRAKITELATQSGAEPDLLARKLAEVDQVVEKYRTAPPDEVMDQVRSPWPTPSIMACVPLMTWRFVSTTPECGLFLTSDNPAVFFEEHGLGNPESELVLPLSVDLALLASWQGTPSATLFLDGSTGNVKGIVREVNRRVASGAERFVFYRSYEEWVAKVSRKAGPYRLNRIMW